MFKCTFSKENILKPLHSAVAIADKKHTMPILSFILFEIVDNALVIKASDLDTEIVAKVELNAASEGGKITLPARKLMDIIRNMPDGAVIEISQESETRALVRSNLSKFSLATQTPSAFPAMKEDSAKSMFKVPLLSLTQVIKRVQFAMANNDVRYFLNGMLWEVQGETFRAIATDGHRMASSELTIEDTYLDSVQMIVPRKAISELQKIISAQEDVEAEIQIGKNYFKLVLPNYQFTSKLIDGRYPDYTRVIPQNNNRVLIANRLEMKLALMRTSILSNEKYRGVRLNLDHNKLVFSANNPEHEEAQDQIEVQYNDQAMEIGFNVGYLLDSMSVLDSEKVDLYFDTPAMSLLIKDDTTKSQYVVSPIRL
ncbi:DNA polymerase III subunit beta [Fangia hongkongensis]|uniref:DNA polymerase III subunit beta n=1 Tax=Fangia hongkongensis TaxID=270495 RepID=UPI00036F06E8|nr:DNA polymerase III subunit beta [Fangia hongkongensis]MBK2125574.1 DNA polymerase III subunit beta [Fangia hongkongensis]